jgi:hypothetical protein
MLAVGEVRTALLQNSVSVPQIVCRQLLQLLPGERVRSSERPIDYAVSPNLLTGVDCHLATESGAKMRGIGTVVTHVGITGCRVLQASTYARLVRARTERRQPWSYYLSQPGVVEATGKASWYDIGTGFLTWETPGVLSLGAISDRMLDGVQLSPELDRVPPFRARRTALRWMLEAPADGDARVHFTITSPDLRTLRVTIADSELLSVVELCEDLALHDWLLTTLLHLIERSQMGTGRDAQMVTNLRPAVDHLLHLWLPGARVAESLLPIWASFERRPGFTRQWEVSVNRIRDQMAMAAISLLSSVPMGT